MNAPTIDELHAAAAVGDRAALARLLTIVERDGPGARRIDELGAQPPSAFTVGVTGAPGAGKSTLTAAFVRHRRHVGERTAVLAIDPSSPFTGGAILGDRVRMQEHATADGVFIRSMASRGQLGGLALATPRAVRLLDTLGWPLVVIETVGVGQVEVDIAGHADTVVVVVNPGWGDAVQANKAGLLEIADVLVINKADRPGAQQTRQELEGMLDLSERPTGSWHPPIVGTVATEATGIAELADVIAAHQRAITATGELQRRRSARRVAELHEIVLRRLRDQVRDRLAAESSCALETAVADGSLAPWEAADRLLG